MKRSREIVAAAGLTASLFGFLPACSAPKDSRPVLTQETIPTPQPRIVALAGKLLELADESPTKTTGKPPHGVGFMVPGTNDSKVSFLVQADGPGLYRPNVNNVQIHGSNNSGEVFDISLVKLEDDSWSAACQNDVSITGSGWAENGQHTAILGPKSTVKEPSIADAILWNIITQAEFVTDSVSSIGEQVITDSLDEVCQFNLGG